MKHNDLCPLAAILRRRLILHNSGIRGLIRNKIIIVGPSRKGRCRMNHPNPIVISGQSFNMRIHCGIVITGNELIWVRGRRPDAIAGPFVVRIIVAFLFLLPVAIGMLLRYYLYYGSEEARALWAAFESSDLSRVRASSRVKVFPLESVTRARKAIPIWNEQAKSLRFVAGRGISKTDIWIVDIEQAPEDIRRARKLLGS